MPLDFTTIQPLAPQILVKRLPVETKYAGFMIELPGVQNFKNRRCEVMAVHKGRRWRDGSVTPPEVSVGDLVEVIVFQGEIIDKYTDESWEIVNESDILAIVEKVPCSSSA
jgi:co-chaperonin GroES (HSP10)